MDPLELPPDFTADHIPAIVVYADGDETRALVWHPLGAAHPNLTATVSRLRRRKIHVLNAPSDFRAAA